MQFFRTSIIAAICIVIGIGIGVSINNPIPITSEGRFEKTENGKESFVFPPFAEAWGVLKEHYIGNLDENKLSYGAVEGMVRAAGDPYTAFSDPEATKQFKETLKGSFSGIGAEMGVKGGLIVVIAPLEGSPAQKAGVKAGDVIVAIDKQNLTEDTSLNDAVRRIRGPKGTQVTLTVIHPQERQTVDITITRDDIAVDSVKNEIKDGIAHISITSFNEDTAAAFAKIAKDVKRQNVRGIILDVRGNPGGYLDAAVDIASEFLDRGMDVVSEKGKTEIKHTARKTGILKGTPLVVLMDGSSASASEIVAGALHDNLDVPLIGEKSFGKGSVQDVIDLSDGSSLRVTIAKWFTPDGTSIADHGIAPTLKVEDDRDTPEDEQLNKAIEELKKKL
jgi:carboxyl-terminal processing protease